MKMHSGINGNAIRLNRELTRSELERFVPSVFSTERHFSRSDRFAHVSTWEVLQHLRKEAGYVPFMATQARTRDVTKHETTKHMLRLRKTANIISDDGLADEIIIVNANDGSSSYKLLSGQFRFVCANGLVLGNIEKDVRIRHSGDARNEVLEGVFTVVDEQEELHDIQARMKSLRLTDRQRQQFAIASYIARDGKPENNVFDYNPMQLLTLHRSADANPDLFSTFNVVQENAIKGGLRRNALDASGKRRRVTTTRAINGIDQNLNVNRSLWQLANEVLEELAVKQY